MCVSVHTRVYVFNCDTDNNVNAKLAVTIRPQLNPHKSLLENLISFRIEINGQNIFFPPIIAPKSMCALVSVCVFCFVFYFLL